MHMIKVQKSLAHMISKHHPALIFCVKVSSIFISFQPSLCCTSTSCPLTLSSLCGCLMGPLKTHIYVMTIRSHLQLELFLKYSLGDHEVPFMFRDNLP